MDVVLDKMDKKIISALMNDSRTTFLDISKDLGVGVSTVYRRVKKLQDAKIIKGFTTIVDNEKIGVNATAFIGINCEKECKNGTLKALSKIKNVVEIYDVLEPYDAFVKVQSSDLKTLKTKVLDKIFDIDGVKGVNTILVLKNVKVN